MPSESPEPVEENVTSSETRTEEGVAPATAVGAWLAATVMICGVGGDGAAVVDHGEGHRVGTRVR